LQKGQRTFGDDHSSVLATSLAKLCDRILTHQADIFTCGFQPPEGKEAVGCWAVNRRGGWGSRAATPTPDSGWVPGGAGFGGWPAPMGTKAGTPIQGCGVGWRAAGWPQCVPHHGTQ